MPGTSCTGHSFRARHPSADSDLAHRMVLGRHPGPSGDLDISQGRRAGEARIPGLPATPTAILRPDNADTRVRAGDARYRNALQRRSGAPGRQLRTRAWRRARDCRSQRGRQIHPHEDRRGRLPAHQGRGAHRRLDAGVGRCQCGEVAGHRDGVPGEKPDTGADWPGQPVPQRRAGDAAALAAPPGRDGRGPRPPGPAWHIPLHAETPRLRAQRGRAADAGDRQGAAAGEPRAHPGRAHRATRAPGDRASVQGGPQRREARGRRCPDHPSSGRGLRGQRQGHGPARGQGHAVLPGFRDGRTRAGQGDAGRPRDRCEHSGAPGVPRGFAAASPRWMSGRWISAASCPMSASSCFPRRSSGWWGWRAVAGRC